MSTIRVSTRPSTNEHGLDSSTAIPGQRSPRTTGTESQVEAHTIIVRATASKIMDQETPSNRGATASDTTPIEREANGQSGSPKFPQLSASTEEILKRLNANNTGPSGYEAMRAQVLKNMVHSSNTTLPPLPPITGRKGAARVREASAGAARETSVGSRGEAPIGTVSGDSAGAEQDSVKKETKGSGDSQVVTPTVTPSQTGAKRGRGRPRGSGKGVGRGGKRKRSDTDESEVRLLLMESPNEGRKLISYLISMTLTDHDRQREGRESQKEMAKEMVEEGRGKRMMATQRFGAQSTNMLMVQH